MSDPRECVISEVLCYVQGKMSSVEHDVIIKAVTSFYGESEIGLAKKLLFDKCCDTKIRYRTYHNEKAKHDCQDIVNKLNEAGLNGPMFVAADVNNLPLATADAFDLNVNAKRLSDCLSLETDVNSVTTILSILQNDFKAVLEHCSQISSIKADVTAMKLKMSPKIPEPETEPEVEIDERPVNYETESEVEIDEHPVNYDADSDSSSTTSGDNSNEDDDEYVANFPSITNDQKKPQIPPKKWLTEGGYRLAHKPKNNCGLKAGSSSRVFVNSGRLTRDTKKYTLKTVKTTKRDSGKYNQKIGVFVSRLDPTTKSRDVAMYLKHVHGKHFKVDQLRNKFPGYASFKINVTSQDQLQPLLNKNNWDSGVFVKEFNVKNKN